MPLLTREQIDERLAAHEGWRFENDAIVKTFVFSGFPEAVAFVARLVPGAEASDHHPDVAIHYKRVTLTYSTHSQGGVTEKDFAGIELADRAAGA